MRINQILSNKILVVLDTSPVRGLAYQESKPGWINVFSQMANNGYSFSLSDATSVELINQFENKGTTINQHLKIIEWIAGFINPDLPVLPSGIDLYGLIGNSNAKSFSLDKVANHSQSAWLRLQDPKNPKESMEKNVRKTERVLQESREFWQRTIYTLKCAFRDSGINIADANSNDLMRNIVREFEVAWDKNSDVYPPLSVRKHLEIRYRVRQFVRSEQKKRTYNPYSKKNRNDGIDFTLYEYLMLPAFVVATDGGFYESLDDIESYQKLWFFNPDKLANEWMAGGRPEPKWPNMPDAFIMSDLDMRRDVLES